MVSNEPIYASLSTLEAIWDDGDGESGPSLKCDREAWWVVPKQYEADSEALCEGCGVELAGGWGYDLMAYPHGYGHDFDSCLACHPGPREQGHHYMDSRTNTEDAPGALVEIAYDDQKDINEHPDPYEYAERNLGAE